MKNILFAISLLVAVISTTHVKAMMPTAKQGFGQEEIKHGGGCRKSSPQGMCCHKNHKTGTVHCH